MTTTSSLNSNGTPTHASLPSSSLFPSLLTRHTPNGKPPITHTHTHIDYSTIGESNSRFTACGVCMFISLELLTISIPQYSTLGIPVLSAVRLRILRLCFYTLNSDVQTTRMRGNVDEKSTKNTHPDKTKKPKKTKKATKKQGGGRKKR